MNILAEFDRMFGDDPTDLSVVTAPTPVAAATCGPVTVHTETVRAEVVADAAPRLAANTNASPQAAPPLSEDTVRHFVDFAVSAAKADTIVFDPVHRSPALVEVARASGRVAVALPGASPRQAASWMADLAAAGALAAPVGLVVADLTSHSDAAENARVIRNGSCRMDAEVALLVADDGLSATLRALGAETRVLPLADGAMGVMAPALAGGDAPEAGDGEGDSHPEYVLESGEGDEDVSSECACAPHVTAEAEETEACPEEPVQAVAETTEVTVQAEAEEAPIPELAPVSALVAAIQCIEIAQVGPSSPIARTPTAPYFFPVDNVVRLPANDNRRQEAVSRLDAMLRAMGANHATRRRLKAITLCSGIEAQAEALRRIGAEIDVVAMSEIGEVQSAILAARHPQAVNLGDLTAPDFCPRAMEVCPSGFDLMFASTPCQAFSLSGLRKGLADERGLITPYVISILNTLGTPLYMWENVLGALSDKTNAFGTMLAALVGEDEPLVAPKGRWDNFGFASGPDRLVAWRVLDAQYWGVPQRRRRVFLAAATIESGIDPREIVFETAA
ncbi:DNA cytosine methyltransferase [Magnetospirillum sp. SS-4]|uniref:DNA cytosine methyltransferase n=1 Tax=Magnetospirillum sp. SS-4 TaxID=2681465 RepID=UPI00137F9595|nr:DNA cytosine methyltransferase [Magnetospirillum sp. SS-4]CAA7619026.1 putative DNA (cytosine-5-)-methyltransferase [Magnetospirillum sp. SS-4]